MNKRNGLHKVTDHRGFACMYARQWNFHKYLDYSEIREEADILKQVYDLLELEPRAGTFRALLGARFRLRMKSKGYHWLNRQRAARLGIKPGWQRLISTVAYDKNSKDGLSTTHKFNPILDLQEAEV